MSKITHQYPRSICKEEKKRKITALLQEQSPLETAAIVSLIPDLSFAAANRYLDELIITGHIRKVTAPGRRKNIRAFEYRNAYNSKTDIVSVALSHPMHQLTLSTAGKVQSQEPG